MTEKQTGTRFIYAVIYAAANRIAYNGEDVKEARKAAKYAEAHGIPYFVVRGEL